MKLHACLLALSLAATGATVPAAQPASEWQPLFNGTDLTGWNHVGPGDFVVDHGFLRTEGGMGLLVYTGEKIHDATLRIVYHTEPVPMPGNSGVFIRIPELPTEPWMPVNKGFEVQIDDNDDDYHRTGVLYSFTQAKAKPAQQEWNTMEITLRGNRTTVTVNGELVTDYTDGSPVPDKKNKWEPDRGPRPDAGYFGLQNHSDKDRVLFREISLRHNP